MAKDATLQLDKTWTAGVGEADIYGTVTIRVVVLPHKEDEEGTAIIPDPDEPFADAGSLDSYLERPRGDGYVVFLVHGQRHDTLDESFVRELGFKYLRTRTMIVIDVDGLAPEAVAQLVQGSRQGFFKGEVYAAILDRVEAVLKKDPDLVRLEEDAEQKIAELKSGDETVRRKLDDLIQGHHVAGQHLLPGDGAKGNQGGAVGQLGTELKNRDVVFQAMPDVGDPAVEPVLVAKPESDVLRMHPDEDREMTIRSLPEEEWVNLQSKQVRFSPPIPELQATISDTTNGAVLRLHFTSPNDIQQEDYPITAKLTFFATFEGKPEPRMVERSLVIRPKRRLPPRPVPTLKAEPTFLKVSSRQPLRLVPGGPSVHVRVRWDGEDHLTTGWPPLWSFTAQCLSLASFTSPIFSKPRGGSFELLLDTPHGLLSGQQLEFEIQAAGPNGARLSAIFSREVVEPAPPPEPRKKQEQAPEGATLRKPPYELKKITQDQWDSPCWGSSKWTKDDAGCFDEPDGSSPLTLIINEDAEVLKTARDQMLAKQLEEKTVGERVERYAAHVYFHLYKMYEYFQEVKSAHEEDDRVRIPSEGDLRSEINRVAVTLSSLMDR